MSNKRWCHGWHVYGSNNNYMCNEILLKDIINTYLIETNLTISFFCFALFIPPSPVPSHSLAFCFLLLRKCSLAAKLNKTDFHCFCHLHTTLTRSHDTVSRAHCHTYGKFSFFLLYLNTFKTIYYHKINYSSSSGTRDI